MASDFFILNLGGDLYLISLVDAQLHTLTRLANHREEKGGDSGPMGPRETNYH